MCISQFRNGCDCECEYAVCMLGINARVVKREHTVIFTDIGRIYRASDSVFGIYYLFNYLLKLEVFIVRCSHSHVRISRKGTANTHFHSSNRPRKIQSLEISDTSFSEK